MISSEMVTGYPAVEVDHLGYPLRLRWISSGGSGLNEIGVS